MVLMVCTRVRVCSDYDSKLGVYLNDCYSVCTSPLGCL